MRAYALCIYGAGLSGEGFADMPHVEGVVCR
jgi:hypothetical protein